MQSKNIRINKNVVEELVNTVIQMKHINELVQLDFSIIPGEGFYPEYANEVRKRIETRPLKECIIHFEPFLKPQSQYFSFLLMD